ncbi:acyl-CoA dehydrogenase family protein [Actinomycetospora cinnamomea]|uniref:Putative acyl-CoA dehydrogenase n=1 Tax=Actinomycetospora cinnamomea TaxID=663609 RepID=A0A2U1F117_9PSEU|nr:acyl-CoA dehydrogenase family protein [Actinomycetospora cinnamomea]PVZ05866.1 putative acyl-CoA dehydrogenase [Actinomycetospora cinnamomea]
MPPTHEVINQVPDLVGHDVAADPPLLEALEREGAGWARDELHAVGRLAGSATAQEWADAAHRHEPRLRTHDRVGHRVDEVDYDPAYQELTRVAVEHGFAGAPWADDRPGAHVARAAGFLTWSQLEAGHGCPISMTYAVLPALRAAPELLATYGPGLTSRVHDPGLRPPAEKRGLLAGMGMTEKQGGSDVRANTTVARPDGEVYRLTGHKWFTSAPMCDLFLVLAQADGASGATGAGGGASGATGAGGGATGAGGGAGLTCFLVPRILPDGTRNTFRIQRLKDKLGNRSNASSEPEFDDTVAWRVGDEGRGVRTIIEMVACTRLDNTLGSAAGMRAAVSRAAHHTRHRAAFGRTLVDQPLMREVLADLACESEAAVTLAMRLAGAQDRAGHDQREAAFRRIGVTLGKYWICKRQTAVVGEALECLGGNGYVEESGMPRLFRESPLNSIWEGSGNVNALDLLRVLAREPAALEAYRDEVLGVDDRVDAGYKDLEPELAAPDERGARRLAERMAVLLTGALLVRHAPSAVADAYVGSRVAGDHGQAFGTLPRGTDVDAVIDRLPDTTPTPTPTLRS